MILYSIPALPEKELRLRVKFARDKLGFAVIHRRQASPFFGETSPKSDRLPPWCKGERIRLWLNRQQNSGTLSDFV